MSSNKILLDGQFMRGVVVGRPVVKRPFQRNGDSVAVIISRVMQVRESSYGPGQVGIMAHPMWPGAYLMDEADPTPTGIDDLLAVPQVFATVPADVVTYGTRVITKPTAESTGLAASLGDYTTSDYVTTHDAGYFGGALFYNNQVFAGRAVVPSFTPPSGGTYTVTYKTSTTAALNYNDSGATIAAAINVLADVVTDGITVAISNPLSSGGAFIITITGATTSSLFMVNGASLTPAAATTVFTAFSGVFQRVSVATRLALTAHGFSSLLTLYVSIRATSWAAVPYTTGWLIIDANTLAVNNNFIGTDPIAAAQYTRDYTPGTDRVGLKLTQKFYLPGVTPGIASPTDIPLPALLINDIELLTAVLSTPTGYLTYDANELSRWNDWPIYTQTLQAVDMATL